MSKALETRAAIELRARKAGKLEGYAAVFNSDSQDLGGFVECIRPGAFSRSLKNSDSILALFDHDGKNVLGRCGAGTLKLIEDDKGLYFDIDLPATTVGKDLSVLVERGDITGASFAFSIPEGGDIWSMKGNIAYRELLDINLHEITITANPAYLDTTVAKRYLGLNVNAPRLRRAQLFLETTR